MKLVPFGKGVFVFGNRQRDNVKLLFWERNGIVDWYKRLEHLPRVDENVPHWHELINHPHG